MKRSLIVIAALMSIVLAWRWRGAGPSVPHDGDHLALDRVWIDHLPKDDKDAVEVFLALTEQPVGVFQASSAWRGHFEIFRYEQQGGQLRVVFPQTGERETVQVKATRCDQAGMDYCLELRGGSRGVQRYYSRKGWEIEHAHGAADAAARADAIVHDLAR